jgi:hypothetical protein
LTRLIAQEYSDIENILCPKPRFTAEFNKRIHIPCDGAFGLWSIQYKALIRKDATLVDLGVDGRTLILNY